MAARRLAEVNGLYVTSRASAGEPGAPIPQQRSPERPALAAFGGRLFLAYKADDPSNDLFVTWSTDGRSWGGFTRLQSQQSPASPALATFGDRLVMAYKADDPSNALFVTWSTDGETWSEAARLGDQQSPEGPALATFGGRLFMAYKANDASNALFATSSVDGHTWHHGDVVRLDGQQSPRGPALAAFKDRLVMAYRANDASNALFVTWSGDGRAWQPATRLAHQESPDTPALAVFADDALIMAYRANDPSYDLYLTRSADGRDWDDVSRLEHRQSAKGPALASFANDIYLAYQGGTGLRSYLDLARRYAPQVRLFPDSAVVNDPIPKPHVTIVEEQFRPSSVDWYLQRVHMRFNVRHHRDAQILGKGITPWELIAQHYRDEASGGMRGSQSDFFLQIPNDHDEDRTRRGELSSARCYAFVETPGGDDEGPVIRYWFFYPYDSVAFGSHEGDWEHIAVRLDHAAAKAVEVTFYYHNHSRSFAGSELEDVGFVAGTHPVVYSAVGTHASYWSVGDFRAEEFYNPHVDFARDGGPLWTCWEAGVLEVVAIDENWLADWVFYSGRWGEIGQAAFTTGPWGPTHR